MQRGEMDDGHAAGERLTQGGAVLELDPIGAVDRANRASR
jgi:hypothetical protein